MKIQTYYINGSKFSVFDYPFMKKVRSEDYNYNFNKKSGRFERYGKLEQDDPDYAPLGPEILDLEISVNGCPNNCDWCYKGNTNDKPTNMSFDTFKNIIDKVNKNNQLTQIALGITGVQTNPDFIKMLKYCREIGVVPNFTLSGIDLTDDLAIEISKFIGACAISVYPNDKNIGYNTIQKFINLSIKQTNMHLMTSRETLPFIYEVLNDVEKDPRLRGLNAAVFLKVKPKGRAKNKFSQLTPEEYGKLIHFCFLKDLNMGFDSCSAINFEMVINETTALSNEQKKYILQRCESCESNSMSAYINVFGHYYPCSFAEGELGWEKGLDVVNSHNFIEDIWYDPKVVKNREKLKNTAYKSGCRKCLLFDEINV